MTDPVADRLGRAAASHEMAVLEGAHAIKHAIRFGARLELIAATDIARAEALLTQVAPDVAGTARPLMREVPEEALAQLRRPVPTGMVAVAPRPEQHLAATGALVLLDHPRDLGNVGAVIRVAAAAGAAGVVSRGELDPWHPAALRGAAGLHFALPVVHGDLDEAGNRELIGFDADGERFDPLLLPADAALVFGGERSGLRPDTRGRCRRLVALPMRDGVSSLNLATSVAAALISWRLATGWDPQEQAR